MNLMDDAKDKMDEVGEKMKDIGEDVKDKADDVRVDMHKKEGEVKGRMDQWKEDHEEE